MLFERKTAQRQWQRFINIRSIVIDLLTCAFSSNDDEEMMYNYQNLNNINVILNKLSMFSNIEKIVLNCNCNHLDLLTRILRQCMTKIKYYAVRLSGLWDEETKKELCY